MAGSRTGSLYTRHATCGRCRNAWVSAARDIIADEHVIGCLIGPLGTYVHILCTSRSSRDSNLNKTSRAHVPRPSDSPNNMFSYGVFIYFFNLIFLFHSAKVYTIKQWWLATGSGNWVLTSRRLRFLVLQYILPFIGCCTRLSYLSRDHILCVLQLVRPYSQMHFVNSYLFNIHIMQCSNFMIRLVRYIIL